MKRTIASALVFVALSASALYGGQQAARESTITAEAPIFLGPDTTREPLRVAKAGSIVRVLDRNDAWCHIEFQDPQFGRRVGYVEAQYVRSQSTEPTDVSIAPQAQPAAIAAAPAFSHWANTSGVLIGATFAQIAESVDPTTGANGASVIIGYGFDDTLTLYGEVVSASLKSTRLTQGDVGLRAHANAVKHAVPYVQLAVSRRVLTDTPASASGLAATFGGGLAVYVARQFGITVSYLATVGSFSRFTVRGIEFSGPSDKRNMSRLSIGFAAFPQPRR